MILQAQVYNFDHMQNKNDKIKSPGSLMQVC